METTFISYGIACRIGNRIYINQDLFDYDFDLYNAILKHEQSHTSSYSMKDIIADLKNNELKGMKLKYYKFILTHPKALAEFLPICKYDGKWIINPLLIAFYGYFLICVGIGGMI